MSFRVGDKTHDFDVIWPPVAIPNKQACQLFALGKEVCRPCQPSYNKSCVGAV